MNNMGGLGHGRRRMVYQRVEIHQRQRLQCVDLSFIIMGQQAGCDVTDSSSLTLYSKGYPWVTVLVIAKAGLCKNTEFCSESCNFSFSLWSWWVAAKASWTPWWPQATGLRWQRRGGDTASWWTDSVVSLNFSSTTTPRWSELSVSVSEVLCFLPCVNTTWQMSHSLWW